MRYYFTVTSKPKAGPKRFLNVARNLSKEFDSVTIPEPVRRRYRAESVPIPGAVSTGDANKQLELFQTFVVTADVLTSPGDYVTAPPSQKP